MNRLTLYLVLLLILPGAVFADGAMLAPYDYDIYESDQTALITYDAETSRESLHIMPKFYGDTQQFAWIVPTPSLPDLSVSQEDLFRDCSILTSPIYRYRDEGWSCSETVSYDIAADNGVQLFSETIVGIYRTLILGASDAAALADSLSAWGFLHAGNREQVEPILADYVAKSWYFTAMRIEPEAFGDSDPYEGYWYGGIQPVAFEFDSDELIYPLAISAISATRSTSVTLYVIDEHRRTFAGAETVYGNRIDAEELSAIGRDYPYIRVHLKEGVFLTRLTRVFSPQTMDRDLVLEPAQNDSEFRRIYYSGVSLFSGLLLLSIMGWPTRKYFIHRRA